MTSPERLSSRRRFLWQFAAGATVIALPELFYVPGVFAEELMRTPRQTEGPFYPDKLPLDTDNDLIVIGDSTTPAVGRITHLSGRVLDGRGDPLRGATIEIWQVDNNGCYLHSQGGVEGRRRDPNFQGIGRFETGSTGEYRFRTILPVDYPGRTPHIHVKVKARAGAELTTQCYIHGHPRNDRDGVLRSAGDARAQQALMVDFNPVAGSRIDELAGKFDIVMG